jgi:hypothetical protein
MKLEESAMLEFRADVACEECVRAYYRDLFRESSPVDVEKFIEGELQVRRKGAVKFVKYNRPRLTKLAAKIARYSK